MNNYLMFKKRLDTQYIPPEAQEYDFFKTSIKKVNDNGEIVFESKHTNSKQRYVDVYNAELPAKKLKMKINRIKSNLRKLKEKYAKHGIEIDPIIMDGLIKSNDNSSDLKSGKSVKPEKQVQSEKPTKTEKPQQQQQQPKPKLNENKIQSSTQPSLADLLEDIKDDEDSSDDDFEVDLDDSKLGADEDDSIDEEEDDEEAEEEDDEEEEEMDTDEDGVGMDAASDDDEDVDDEEDDEDDDDDEEEDDESDDNESEDAIAPPSPPKRKASQSDPKFKNLAKKEPHGIKKAKDVRKQSIPDVKTMKKLKGLIEKNQNQMKQVKLDQKFGKKK